MAKLNTPKGKLVRKLGVNIFGNPKFDRLLSKKGYGPGQHGKSGKRFSTYSVQLKEKQKIKFTYGMLEKQFRNYFEKASQIRDRLKRINHLKEEQSVVTQANDVDIFSVCSEMSYVGVSIIVVRNGKIRGTKTHLINPKYNFHLAYL